MRQDFVPKETGLITTQQAAELAGRSKSCIKKWEKLGYIKPTLWLGRKYYAKDQFFQTGQSREVPTHG